MKPAIQVIKGIFVHAGGRGVARCRTQSEQPSFPAISYGINGVAVPQQSGTEVHSFDILREAWFSSNTCHAFLDGNVQPLTCKAVIQGLMAVHCWETDDGFGILYSSGLFNIRTSTRIAY